MLINIERELRHRITPNSQRHVFTCRYIINEPHLNLKFYRYFIYRPTYRQGVEGKKFYYRWSDSPKAAKQFKKSEPVDDDFFELMRSYLG